MSWAFQAIESRLPFPLTAQSFYPIPYQLSLSFYVVTSLSSSKALSGLEIHVPEIKDANPLKTPSHLCASPRSGFILRDTRGRVFQEGSQQHGAGQGLRGPAAPWGWKIEHTEGTASLPRIRNCPGGLFLSGSLLCTEQCSELQFDDRSTLLHLQALLCLYIEGRNGTKYHLSFVTLLCFQAER